LDRWLDAADTHGMTHDLGFEPLSITRRDPDLNMARFYAIALQPTLFGEVSVVRAWGRIGTRGRMKLATFPSLPAAKHQAIALERQKRRRGYR
jgi:predicted DNA-binding WGR domain protein